MTGVRRGCCLLLLVLMGATVLADPGPRVREWAARERVYQGVWGDQPLTLRLYVHEFSPGHRQIYSLAGAYRRGTQQWVPLVGLHHPEGWVLYRFKDAKRSNELLEFTHESGRFWDDIAHYRTLSGWAERLEVNRDGSGVWQDGKSREEVEIHQPDLRVYHPFAFLEINEGEGQRYLDLTSLGLPPEGNELQEWRRDEAGLTVLLRYSHPSRAYALGMCGAGDERGLVRLSLDPRGHLRDWRELPLDSCMRSRISHREATEEGDWLYRVQDSDGQWQSWLLDQHTLDWRSVDASP